MSIDDFARDEAMVRRVIRTGRALGMERPALALVERACTLAFTRRRTILDDDHDPHYLHPGRSALVLLLDTGELNPVLPAAAALAESVRAELKVPDEEARAGCPSSMEGILDHVLRLRSELPIPGSGTSSPLPSPPSLLEDLVAAGEAVRRVALAERLDHVRHVHVWPASAGGGTVLQRAWLDEVETVWLPVAIRTHARLATRFERWAAATRRRLARLP